jgi:hypothetical protein
MQFTARELRRRLRAFFSAAFQHDVARSCRTRAIVRGFYGAEQLSYSTVGQMSFFSSPTPGYRRTVSVVYRGKNRTPPPR